MNTMKTALLALSLMLVACDQEPTASVAQPATSAPLGAICVGYDTPICTQPCLDCVKQYGCSGLTVTASDTGECVAICASCN